MKLRKLVPRLFLLQILCLAATHAVVCQTETLGIARYTPPSGWTRTPKDNAVVFSDLDKAGKTFCVLTIGGGMSGSGDPAKDFAIEWGSLVAAPYKTSANPKTETETTPDGWTAISAAAEVSPDGVKSYVVLTVFSGFGKTLSVQAISNEPSYLTQIQTFLDGIKLDKTKTISGQSPTPVQNYDPFPDRPGGAPQTPLAGTLKISITLGDLAGSWDHGAGSVLTYIDAHNGTYSGTDTSFYGEQYEIKANGTFGYKFIGRASDRTVRESDTGTVILAGGYITFKFKIRPTQKYQLISFMNQPNGAAVLSLVPVGNKFEGYDAAGLAQMCGHSKGFINCVSGEEWARLKM